MRKYIHRVTGAAPSLASDSTMCLLLEPDEYEKQDEQYILTSHALRRKINKMLGIVVQHDFYEREMEQARREGGQKMAECIAKLFNVYQTGRVQKWITGDRIRPLQDTTGRRIDSCSFETGQDWRVFVGLDFSHGDDLYAITYLGVNYSHAQVATSMRGLMFADTEAWVLEDTLEKSPNRDLYRLWIAQGWLHVCPGEVFDSNLAINAMARRLFHTDADGNPDRQRMRLNIVAFAYDPAQSRSPINTLQAWLQSIGIAPDGIKQMVLPCSQSAMTMNPVIGAAEEMILAQEPWIVFSGSPLWPYCFGNSNVELGRTDLRRIVKGATSSDKIDCVAAFLDATWAFMLSEGKLEPV